MRGRGGGQKKRMGQQRARIEETRGGGRGEGEGEESEEGEEVGGEESRDSSNCTVQYVLYSSQSGVPPVFSAGRNGRITVL